MCANFGCQHMPSCFLIKLAYQETLLKAKTALKYWEAFMHQSHLISIDEEIRSTTHLDMVQDNSFTLLLTFPHLQWDMSLSTHHLGDEHSMQWLEPSSHSFNNHKCIKWPNHHKDNWSLHCSSTNNNIIGLINENTTIMVQMVKIKLLSIINLRHLNDITSQNIAEYKIMPNLYSQNSTYKRMSRNTNLDCIMILDQHSRLSAFWGKNG